MLNYENLLGYGLQNSESATRGGSFHLDAGGGFDSEGWLSGDPQYAKGTVGQGEITIRAGNTSGPIVASCTVSITDDDNSAYVGQRNHHPYGGTWQTTPKCYTPGCGWQ